MATKAEKARQKEHEHEQARQSAHVVAAHYIAELYPAKHKKKKKPK